MPFPEKHVFFLNLEEHVILKKIMNILELFRNIQLTCGTILLRSRCRERYLKTFLIFN